MVAIVNGFVNQQTSRSGVPPTINARPVDSSCMEACVRPLYDVYDQDGDGLVSMEEFIGCQTILQNSLGLKSKVSLEAQLKFVGQTTVKAKKTIALWSS